MPPRLTASQDLDHKIDDLKAELERLQAQRPGIENEIAGLMIRTRFLATDEERAQLEMLEGQLQTNRERIEQINQDLKTAETEREGTLKREFERLETERRELADQLAGKARVVIAARQNLTSKRIELLPKFEALAQELNEGVLIEYLQLHREFVKACRRLGEIEANLSGNERFSPAVQALIDKVESEAGPRPESPKRTPKELEELFKTLQFICHGCSAERDKVSLSPLSKYG